MNNQDKHQEYRKQLWINVCTAVAGANNTHTSEVACRWADNALRKFDEKFPKPGITHIQYEQGESAVIHPKISGQGMMCKPQHAQINCLADNCYYNQGMGYCSHRDPEFNVAKYKEPVAICRSFKEHID